MSARVLLPTPRLDPGSNALRNWAVAYLALWILTATVGVHCVASALRSQVTPGSFELSYDPTPENLPRPNREWHVIGRAFSPCPCIVSIDHTNRTTRPGRGSRLVFFWIPGYLCEIPFLEHIYWKSQ